jgi:Domain of unknown function (DUF6916)
MTQTSRRALLRAGVFAVVAAPLAAPRAAWAAATSADRLYRRSRFASLRRKSFRVEGGGRMTLVAVTDLAHAPRGDQNRFVLTFTSPTAGPRQGSYTLRRAGFASTTLFLVPGDATRRTYQAVVNRMP